ncbi:hypothetical protein [Shewanella halifaxensis]|uniref:hypothetical protein n=1 Tax=Shewanella halifaxensis TaxID=271098 RepID=UPI00031DA4B2|nr:hypothetical protein [Shewanella halifaxensis]
MTIESMLYQKVDMLNGLFSNLDTEDEKDVCNAIISDVLAIYERDHITEGLVPAAAVDAELGRGLEQVPTQ